MEILRKKTTKKEKLFSHNFSILRTSKIYRKFIYFVLCLSILIDDTNVT